MTRLVTRLQSSTFVCDSSTIVYTRLVTRLCFQNRSIVPYIGMKISLESCVVVAFWYQRFLLPIFHSVLCIVKHQYWQRIWKLENRTFYFIYLFAVITTSITTDFLGNVHELRLILHVELCLILQVVFNKAIIN